MDSALRSEGNASHQPLGQAWDPGREDVLELLATARQQRIQPIYYGSNHTFLVVLESDRAGQSLAVYKPARGEYPLYDFAHGSLYRREVATYLVDQILQWHMVPPTIVVDGTFGPGSLQLFVEASDGGEVALADLRRLALLDVLVNNADRKAEHCLVSATGKLWGIDHGLTFHSQPKLRTVLWHFAGTKLTAEDRHAVKQLENALERGSSPDVQQLRALISSSELRALETRVKRVLNAGRFPDPQHKAVPYRW